MPNPLDIYRRYGRLRPVLCGPRLADLICPKCDNRYGTEVVGSDSRVLQLTFEDQATKPATLTASVTLPRLHHRRTLQPQRAQ